MAAPQNSVIRAAAEPQRGLDNHEPSDSELRIPHTSVYSDGMRVPGFDVLPLPRQTGVLLPQYRFFGLVYDSVPRVLDLMR